LKGVLRVIEGTVGTTAQMPSESLSYLGEPRIAIGEPTWKALDREMVEALVGSVI
jgi:hypothetical protein